MKGFSLIQRWILFGLLTLVGVLSGLFIWASVAAGNANPSPSPLPSVQSSLPPAPTPKPTPSPTPSPAPSPTLAPTPEPTPSPTPSKLIAVTFDDGPGQYTDRLLDELKKRDIHITFFVIGQNAEKHPETLKRIAVEGHEIANHTMDHIMFRKLSRKETAKQIADCSDLIEELTGKRPTLLRPPGGEYTSDNLKEFKRQGLAAVNWWVDTQDWRTLDKDKILKEAFEGDDRIIRDGAIVLLHDIYEPSVEAGIEMIDRLIDDGYKIVTVTELLETRKGEIVPGEVYTGGFPPEEE